MSAQLYPVALGELINGTLDWTELDVRALLLSEAFTFDPSARFRDEISDSYVIGTSDVMTRPTFVDGVASGDPFVWQQIFSNRLAHHIVLFADSGDDAYSELLAYYSADSVTGLPARIVGEDYYFFPVVGSGFFILDGVGNQIGPVNSYRLAYPLSLAEGTGVVHRTSTVIFGRNLHVRAKICLMPDEVDESCCKPTIRSSRCE